VTVAHASDVEQSPSTLSAAPASVTDNSAKDSNKSKKLEELFIWKISDELKLSTPQEKTFGELFKNLNQKKLELAHKQEDILSKLDKADEKNLKDLLKSYRQTLEEYNKLQLSEIDSFRKNFGDTKAAKYLVVKRDLTNKVKTLLTEKTEKAEKELPPPKVIEE
jgi:hypothetical protein